MFHCCPGNTYWVVLLTVRSLSVSVWLMNHHPTLVRSAAVAVVEMLKLIAVVTLGCHSIGFRCNFCFPLTHLTDLPPKFHKGLKTAKFWAILRRFYHPHTRPIGWPPFQNSAILQNHNINLFCIDDQAIISWNLVKIGPSSLKSVWVFVPPKCAKSDNGQFGS